MTGFDDNQKAILVLFITLTYGNTNIPLAIPYWFAQKHNIFTETVRAIRREAENKSRQEEREAVEKIRFGWEERLKEIKRDRRDVGSEITDMAAFEKSWQEDNEKRLRKIREYQRENADRAILELIPLNLPSKIMTPGERQAILRACRAEFDTNCNTAIRVVENFVNFCILLSDPSNHIMVKSGQYVERPIPSRTIGDMVNEMEGELTELPKYTAYAKILQGKEMRKGKITTHQLPTKTYTWSPDQMRFFTNDLCRTRKEIEEAIRTRQESWRPKIEEVEEIEPEAPKMGEKRTAKKKTNIDAKPSSKPPPTSYD